MNNLRKKRGIIIFLLSYLISVTLTVDKIEATLVQPAVKKQDVEVASFSSEGEIPGYLTQTEQALREGRFDTVVAMSEKVLSQQPDNVTARALLAAAYSVLGSNELAQRELSKLQKSAPGNSSVYIYQAQAYQATGQEERAEKVFQEGIKNSTGKTELTILLAALYREQEKYKDAYKLLEDILQQKELTPKDYLNASFALCGINLHLQRYDQVVKQANQIITNYPPIPQGYNFLATAYLKKGDPTKAILAYKMLIEVNSKIAESYHNIALIYMDQLNNGNKALQYAEQAASQFPNDAKSQDVLGWVLYKGEMNDRAMQQFKLAIQLSPKRAVYHYHLGLAQLQAKNTMNAKKSFIEALNQTTSQGAENFAAELHRQIKKCGE